MCARTCVGTHAREWRVHKPAARMERAGGRRGGSSTLSDACARDFSQNCRAVLPFVVVGRRVARVKGFSVVGSAYGLGRCAKGGARRPEHCHPVIQTAPQTQISGLGSCVGLKL